MRSPEAVQIAVQRELGLRGGLYDFVKMAWPLVEPNAKYVDGWHVGVICEHLEAVTRGQIRRLIINEPPGCMKSLLVSVFWPAWQWIQKPDTRFIYGSFDGSLTIRDAGRMLDIVGSDWFRARWGDKFTLPTDIARGDFANSAGGFRFSTSVGGKATGRHGDVHVFDDPTKPQTVSKVTLEDAIRWWDGTMATRARDHKTLARLGIMQRLHEKDLAAHCIEQGYELLCLRMRYEASNPCVTSIGGDPRTVDGELLWPEHVDEEALATLERELGPNGVAAQLQQRPSPEGGAIFQREWFRHWRHVNTADKPDAPRTPLPERFDQLLWSWDLAFKDANTSDFVAGQLWGRKGPDFFLIARVKKRLSFSGTVAEIRAQSALWPRAITKLIEDKANGPAVCDALKKEIAGIVMVNPEGGKEARANAVSGLFHAQNVHLPPPETHPWVHEYMNELATFPVGSNDDEVDATTQALLYMYRRRSNFAAAMAQVRKNGGRMVG